MPDEEQGNAGARRAAAAVTGVVGGGAGVASLAGDDAPAPDAVLAAGDDVLGISAPVAPAEPVVVETSGATLGDEVAIGRDVEIEALAPPDTADDPVDPALGADLGAIELATDDVLADGSLTFEEPATDPDLADDTDTLSGDSDPFDRSDLF